MEVHPDIDVITNDMKYHVEFGAIYCKDNNEVMDVTRNSLFSGMLFIVEVLYM